jgi:hypothetical protein
VTRELAAGASHKYVPVLPSTFDTIGFVEVVDVSGATGEFRFVEQSVFGIFPTPSPGISFVAFDGREERFSSIALSPPPPG